MNVSSAQNAYGQQALVAALGKRQQIAQGQTSLALLQSAAQTQQTSTQAAPAASGSVGTHINIQV